MKIVVEGPRALMQALDALEKERAQAVTYEDPYYPDLAGTAFSTGAPDTDGLARERLGVDWSALSGEFTKAVEELVAEYDREGHAGLFRVEQSAGLCHVVPFGMRRRDGTVLKREPVLSAEVSLPSGERLGTEFLDELVAVLSRAASVPLNLGTVPLNLVQQHRTSLGGERVAAREILSRFVGELPQTCSWRLLCDWNTAEAALNMHLVRS
jgi:hypothetical protein